MKLAGDRFQAARQFIVDHARPVDKAWFACHFEGGPAEAVLDELAAFQNADGGFGHGLEMDFRTPRSTPMATSLALQYAVPVGTLSDHPLIAGAVAYLLDTYEAEDEYWPFTYPYVKDAPHAPWWATDTLAAPDAAAWPNPSAEIFGYLFAYPGHVPADLLADAERILSYHIAQPDSTTNKYNLLCWERALPHLSSELRSRVEAVVTAAYTTFDLSDKGLAELEIFVLTHSPDSLLGRARPDDVRARFDAVSAKQADDGAWWPNWAWIDFEDEWQIARREWAGKLTVEALLALKNYGMLE